MAGDSRDLRRRPRVRRGGLRRRRRQQQHHVRLGGRQHDLRVVERQDLPRISESRTTPASTSSTRASRTRCRAGRSCGTTYLPLLGYKHVNGPDGATLVPYLAQDMPTVSADGKTYTLTLRKGLKYSDGTAIKASDFAATIERDYKIDSPGVGFFGNIVGADAFSKTRRRATSAGITTDDATGKITIKLKRRRVTSTTSSRPSSRRPCRPARRRRTRRRTRCRRPART